ncbi:MAG: hypothetical protein QM704_21500 [Anaeromyxobacteraceae bacterium]
MPDLQDGPLMEGGRLSDGAAQRSLDTAAGIVRELGAFGVPLILWTAVFCTALWKVDGQRLDWMFGILWQTWVALLVVSVGPAMIAGVAAWRSRQGPVAVPQAEKAPSLDG